MTDDVQNNISEKIIMAGPNNQKMTGEDGKKPNQEIKNVSAKKVKSLLSADGPFAKDNDKYEERESQLSLASKMTTLYNKGQLGVFEAGTGVGKSYAYLIPAIFYAALNNERTIITTGTIALQDQLINKDIPRVLDVMKNILSKTRDASYNVNFMAVKGRNNYICKRRLLEAMSGGTLLIDADGGINDIVNWANKSKTGCLSDLPFTPAAGSWAAVNSETESCIQKKCPHFDNCFVTKMKREAENTLIIVANHHVLFADIESRLNSGSYDETCVLPAYHHLIFDEAHTIDSAAISFFSESFNEVAISALLFSLFRYDKNKESGTIAQLAALINGKKIKDLLSEAIKHVTAITTSAANLTKIALLLLKDNHTARLCEATAGNFLDTLNGCKILLNSIENFLDYCDNLCEMVGEEDKTNNAYWGTKSSIKKLAVIENVIKDFIHWEASGDNVFHLQKAAVKVSQGTKIIVVFERTPLDISRLMARGVYEHIESVAFLSATLKVSRDFNYYKIRMGLNLIDKEVVTAEFSSPFDYQKNMALCVATDSPDPRNSEFQKWSEKAIIKLIIASRGRTLVLFTNYQALNLCYKVAKEDKSLAGYNIFWQGQEQAGKLLEKFRHDTSSVLFATSSFWQGIDVPGESLSQVIIVKLPFTVPNDPVYEARAEILEKNGGNSFFDLMLPDAITKFRQGAGRLIRSQNDRGVVTVLDSRLVQKSYGQNFINSISTCLYEFAPFNKVEKYVKSFFEKT